jgi:hypothetical protein
MRIARVLGATAILLGLLIGSAHAAVISPGTLDLTIGGTSLRFVADERGILSVSNRQVLDANDVLIAEIVSLQAELDPDPFIAYGLSVKNFTDTPLAFTFGFLSPYVGGSFNTLESEHSSTVTDGDMAPDFAPGVDSLSGGTVTVTPYAVVDSSFIHVPHVDGVLVPGARLGDGCVELTGPCDPLSSASVGIATLAAGTFDVYVSFVLSELDSYSASGRSELKNVPIPEPASLSLLAVGLGLAGARRWRTRRHLRRA